VLIFPKQMGVCDGSKETLAIAAWPLVVEYWAPPYFSVGVRKASGFGQPCVALVLADYQCRCTTVQLSVSDHAASVQQYNYTQSDYAAAQNSFTIDEQSIVMHCRAWSSLVARPVTTLAQHVNWRWVNGCCYDWCCSGTGDGNLDYASQLLKQCLMRYPHGALFLFLEARLLQVTGKIDEVSVAQYRSTCLSFVSDKLFLLTAPMTVHCCSCWVVTCGLVVEYWFQFKSHSQPLANCWPVCSVQLSLLPSAGREMSSNELHGEGLVWLIGVVVCLRAALWVQLLASVGSGWLHSGSQIANELPLSSWSVLSCASSSAATTPQAPVCSLHHYCVVCFNWHPSPSLICCYPNGRYGFVLTNIHNYPPPVGGRGIVFGRFLSLFLCQQHYKKTAGPIYVKFSGKVWSDHGTTWLNFGSIRINGSAGQRSICLLSPAIAQRTGVNKSVSFARWQQGSGFVVPRTTAC